uniref:Ig-like domain-containing protein n=1 Tax=Oryzias latipes TaxID=8090 RepID=A0A3B3HIY3_ORYLA
PPNFQHGRAWSGHIYNTPCGPPFFPRGSPLLGGGGGPLPCSSLDQPWAGWVAAWSAERVSLGGQTLHNLESEAGQSASFRCETTKPGAIVVWKCADRILATSSKYQLKQDGAVVELVIHKLQSADSGEYSCDTGYQRTSAVLTVKVYAIYCFFCVGDQYHLDCAFFFI